MINRLLLITLLGVSSFFVSFNSFSEDSVAPAPAVVDIVAPAPAVVDIVAPAPAVVNINSADAKTLATVLNGIGESKAKEIIRYREAYGPFYTKEDLLEVRGVGKSILTNNHDRITLE